MHASDLKIFTSDLGEILDSKLYPSYLLETLLTPTKITAS